MVDTAGHGPINPDRLTGPQIEGAAVLLRTGWDRHCGTDHYGHPSHPHLTEAAAESECRQVIRLYLSSPVLAPGGGLVRRRSGLGGVEELLTVIVAEQKCEARQVGAEVVGVVAVVPTKR